MLMVDIMLPKNNYLSIKMANIIGSKPTLTCSCCNTTFEYCSDDVETHSEQVWKGFWKSWEYVDIRYVVCPGCRKAIKLD